MLNMTAVSIVACGVGLAQASVITGSFDDPYALPAVLGGTGVSLTVDGYTHGDEQFHQWWLDGGVFLVNADGGGLGIGGAFLEGAVLSDAHQTESVLHMGTASYIQDDGGFWVYASVGEVGQSLYLGFRTSEFLADEDRFEHRYGFIQAIKRDELQYEYVGWAYETEADTPLVTFNLVPAPSVAALLGLGGLAATRRRR